MAKQKSNRVPITPFRFDEETKANIDELMRLITAETGVAHTRPDAVRAAIRRELNRARKRAEKNPDKTS